MSVLHNRISNRELKARMLAEAEPRTTLSFYKYFNLPDPQEFRDRLYREWIKLAVFGRVYIATEGINAQVSVPLRHYDEFKKILFSADPALAQIRLNAGLQDDGKSFWVLRMKVRTRIVADGIDDENFNPMHVGTYLNAKQVNEMLDSPDALFVDMRNHYEYEVGHFSNALQIPSDTFREQLSMAVTMLQQEKDKKIVLYCTGGIRCEKASAWMLYNGFKQVYHIEGGIIDYVRKAKEQALPVKFIGKNFVFDERMGERVSDDVIALCHQCHNSSDSHTNCKNDNCHLLFIQCADCARKFNGCCSEICHDEWKLLDCDKPVPPRDDKNRVKVFNKSKKQRHITQSFCCVSEKNEDNKSTSSKE